MTIRKRNDGFRPKTILLVALDIAELVGDKEGPANDEAAIGEELIAAVVVGMAENPIVDVRMGLNELFHIDLENYLENYQENYSQLDF